MIGYSGSIIKIINNKVYKISKNIESNIRLKIQYEKQLLFTGNEYIKKPEIYNCGYLDDGCFYFVMEYIDGDNFVNLSNSKKKQIFSVLIDFIDFNIQTSKVVQYQSMEILNKIDSLKLVLYDDLDIVNILNFLNTYVIYDYISGYSHGDLTFDNMVIKNNDIFLFDFLNNILETPYNDIIKLRQCTYYNWNNQNNIDLTIYDKLIQTKFHNIINTPTFKLLNILNLIRLLPYIKLHLKLYNNIKGQIINEYNIITSSFGTK